MLCPGDEDWRFVPLNEPHFIDGWLAAPDGGVQLTLLNGEGDLLQTSAKGVSIAEVYSECLPPGEYFLRASAPSKDVPIGYTFELSTQPCGGCCESGDGCLDPTIAECVCVDDDFCCTVSWDQACVNQAVRFCGARCPL